MTSPGGGAPLHANMASDPHTASRAQPTGPGFGTVDNCRSAHKNQRQHQNAQQQKQGQENGNLDVVLRKASKSPGGACYFPACTIASHNTGPPGGTEVSNYAFCFTVRKQIPCIFYFVDTLCVQVKTLYAWIHTFDFFKCKYFIFLASNFVLYSLVDN